MNEYPELIAKDFYPIFEDLETSYNFEDLDSLLDKSDRIRFLLNNDLLLDLEQHFPEVVDFMRNNFPEFSNS